MRNEIDRNPRGLKDVLMHDQLRKEFLDSPKSEAKAVKAFAAGNAENALKTKPKVCTYCSLKSNESCVSVWASVMVCRARRLHRSSFGRVLPFSRRTAAATTFIVYCGELRGTLCPYIHRRHRLVLVGVSSRPSVLRPRHSQHCIRLSSIIESQKCATGTSENHLVALTPLLPSSFEPVDCKMRGIQLSASARHRKVCSELRRREDTAAQPATPGLIPDVTRPTAPPDLFSHRLVRLRVISICSMLFNV